MFIMLRPKLKHNWASKIVVAAILAIAVCCMHFCGESTVRASERELAQCDVGADKS
jgi:NO-binding membrane sensor protein with MHYT domain